MKSATGGVSSVLSGCLARSASRLGLCWALKFRPTGIFLTQTEAYASPAAAAMYPLFSVFPVYLYPRQVTTTSDLVVTAVPEHGETCDVGDGIELQ